MLTFARCVGLFKGYWRTYNPPNEAWLRTLSWSKLTTLVWMWTRVIIKIVIIISLIIIIIIIISLQNLLSFFHTVRAKRLLISNLTSGKWIFSFVCEGSHPRSVWNVFKEPSPVQLPLIQLARGYHDLDDWEPSQTIYLYVYTQIGQI